MSDAMRDAHASAQALRSLAPASTRWSTRMQASSSSPTRTVPRALPYGVLVTGRMHVPNGAFIKCGDASMRLETGPAGR